MARIELGIFSADLHLTVRTRSSFPDMVGDSYFALRQLVDLANEKMLPLILGGDIFDKAMVDSLTLATFIDELNRLQPGLPVYAVEGDHELAQPRWFTFSSRVIPLQGDCYCLSHAHDIWLTGVDFLRADRLAEGLEAAAALVRQDSRASNPDRMLLVTHEGWSEIRTIGVTEGSFKDIPLFKYILTGDYHVPGFWNGTGKDGQSVTAVSPGSTCMQAVDEPQQKGAVLVVWEGGAFKFEPLPLLTRPFHKYVLTDRTQVAETASQIQYLRDTHMQNEALPPDVRVPFIYVETRAEIGSLLHDLRTAATGMHFHAVHREELPVFNTPQITQQYTELSMSSVLRELVTDENVLANALDLWRANEPTQVVQTIVSKVKDAITKA